MFLLPESRYREVAACDREGGWRMRSPDLVLRAVPGVKFMFLSWECLAVSTKQSQTGSGTRELPGAPSHHGAGGWRWRPERRTVLGSKILHLGSQAHQETKETLASLKETRRWWGRGVAFDIIIASHPQISGDTVSWLTW